MADHAEYNTVVPVEDHSANLLPEDARETASEAILEGRKTAEANAKAEAKNNTSEPAGDFTQSQDVKDVQKLAKLNHKVDQANATAGYEIAKNDTTKAGKVRATKAQLDPTGNDPINDAELKRAATDGRNVEGTTSVSDKEVSRRAENPGEAEEKNPLSTARKGVDAKKLKATDDAVHTNDNETKTTGEGGMADLVGPANKTVDGAHSKKNEAPAR